MNIPKEKAKYEKMKDKIKKLFKDRQGMELVQCAILVAIAVALGILFRSEITSFVNRTFSSLSDANF